MTRISLLATGLVAALAFAAPTGAMAPTKLKGTVEVHGYTDKVGSNSYALVLSLDRANAVNSPHSGSGRPTTATSATPGCRPSTSSTSRG